MTARKLSPQEWADAYGIPVTTVRQQIREGRIKAVNVGTQRRPMYRIPESEILRYDRINAA